MIGHTTVKNCEHKSQQNSAVQEALGENAEWDREV